MIKKSFIVLILQLVVFTAFTQKVEELDLITEALIGLRLEEARLLVEKYPEDQLSGSYEILRQILFNKGRDKFKDSLRISTSNTPNHRFKDSIVLNLCQAYYLLYNDRDDSLAFTYFDKAYIASKEHREVELEKLSLLGFLHLYSKEIVRSSGSFSTYLELYKSCESTTEDLAWQRYFDNYFTLSLLAKDKQYAITSNRLIEYLQTKNLSLGLKAYFLKDIGLYYKLTGATEKAMEYFNEVLELPDYNYLLDKKYNALLYLCDIESAKGDFDASRHYLERSKKFMNLSDTLAAQANLERFKAVYFFERKSQYDSAYYSLKSSVYKNVLMGVENGKSEIRKLNVQLRTAEKEKQILIEQQRATTNRNWLIAAGIALLFGSGIAILLQKNTTKKRKLAEQAALLEQQKVTTLLKEQELVSLDAMIAGQEKERTKVANELHDDLGSLMATVKLHFDNVKVDEKDSAMKNAQDLLEKAYQKIRGMAHAKNSGVMANQGLLPAVQKMAKTINETNALEVTVEDFGLADRMENSLELTIFRIIQELVANIVKHSDATKATIQFTQHEDKLNIIVEDNGKGFEMGKVKTAASGMGLTTIEKRIEHLEGSFTVDSLVGKGTSILMDIPV